MKKLVLTALITLVGFGTSLRAQNLPVVTDPYNNTGSSYFSSFSANTANGAILPNIIKPYLPSGNLAQNALATDIRNAPDIGAVEAIILFIAQVFSCKSTAGETGKLLWSTTMLIALTGLMLSGILIFQAVAQGKKGPGEAIVSFTTKAAIVFIMYSVVCPNIPFLLLGLSNELTHGIDQWFHNTGTDAGDKNLAESTWSTKMWAGHSAAQQTLYRIMTALATGMNNERGKAILAQISSDSAIADAVGYNFPTSDQNLKSIVDGMVASHKSFADINSVISRQAQSFSPIVIGQVKKIAEQVLAQNNSNKAGDQAQLKEIMDAPAGQDLSKFTYPGRVIGTAAYIAFTYLGISIWGMGIASLIWVMIYSLPEEWNMGGILYSGGKAGIGIILAIILISIYISTSLGYADDRSISEATGQSSAFWNGVKDAASATWGGGLGLVGTAWDIIHNGTGAVVGKMIAKFTGFTLEQFMIAMLILTAPAQAVGIVKGGNGIAEHAKSAMAAQGAASSSIGGMLGMRNGSSGASFGGGQTASSIMAGRGNFAPNSLNN